MALAIKVLVEEVIQIVSIRHSSRDCIRIMHEDILDLLLAGA